ncbi:sensor histidine kinase [Actinomadura harenae]|nr:histidine kinase [Actinomadura harenae]
MAFGLAVVPPVAGLQPLGAGAWVVSVAAALPLVARRRWPVAVFAVSAAVSLLGITVGAGAFLAAALALYTVASGPITPRRPSTGLVGGFSAAGVVALAAVGAPAGVAGTVVPRVLLGLVLLGGAWTAGRAVAERRRNAEREIERARMDERLRIAREMHDVVTHGMGLIAVQAGVANHVVAERPEEARRALEVIEEVSRRSLGEMRAMLGVLRGDAEEAVLEPAPGLSGLPVLVGAAGPRFDLHAADLREDDVPGGVQLAAFRIVQEALTNVARHAAGSARCRVVVRNRPGRLEVEVRDSGPARGGTSGGGYGLIGMRERALAHAGEFEAGATPDGGFEVRALLRY